MQLSNFNSLQYFLIVCLIIEFVVLFIPSFFPDPILPIPVLVYFISSLTLFLLIGGIARNQPMSPNPAEIMTYFSQNQGSFSLRQETYSKRLNFVKCAIRSDKITFSSDKDAFHAFNQRIKKITAAALPVSVLLPLVPIYIRSFIFETPMLVIIQFLLPGLTIFLGIVITLVIVTLKATEKSFPDEVILNIERMNGQLKFTTTFGPNILAHDEPYRVLIFRINAKNINAVLSISSVTDLYKNNKDKMSKSMQILNKLTSSLVKFPPGLLVDLDDPFVAIEYIPKRKSNIEKLGFSEFLIFQYHNKEIVETLQQGIVQWSSSEL